MFDLGEAGLLIRPAKPPSPKQLEAALAATRPRHRANREVGAGGSLSPLLIARDPDLAVLEKPFGIEIATPRQLLQRLPRAVRGQLG